MPTWETADKFRRDLADLTPDQKEAFRRAVEKFVVDLGRGQFRNGLRVKGVQGTTGVYEMTWADDGRATFEYGEALTEGEPHVIWRRVGSHVIFSQP